MSAVQVARAATKTHVQGRLWAVCAEGRLDGFVSIVAEEEWTYTLVCGKT
jgi:hypothetical protein